MSIYISASSISDYLKCEKVVDFRINAPERGVQNENMLIGSMVHNIIEKYWNDEKKGTEELTLQLNALNFGKQLNNKALTSIGNFYTNYASLFKETDLVEHRFKIKLHDDVYLVGKMDRISDDMVYDWKTAFKPPTELTTDPQFIIYYTAFVKLFEKQPTSVFGVYLMHNKIIPYVPDKYYIDLLYNGIMPRMISDIRNKALPKSGRFKGICDKCIFNKHCFEEDENVLENKNTFI